MSASGVIAAVAAVAIGVGGTGYALGVPAVVSATAALTGSVAANGPSDTTAVKPSKPAKAKGRSFVIVAGPKPPPTRITDDSIEVNSSATTQAAPAALCASNARQRAVETALSALPDYDTVVVDGRQSPGDCAVIRRFQQRFGIEPAHGQPDATTAGVARRIAASNQPGEQEKCAAGDGVTACVDLTLQTAWVVQDGTVVLGPTVVRTGFRGYATPTGTYRVNRRGLREWSNPYGVWLPYWQRFVGGIGFHETTTYIHDAALGSHGCVNLLRTDAAGMWEQLRLGTTVHTFGRRLGT
jgi:lipoprotein-anchoring transpeptidase ErfK/SrfK